MSFLALIPIAAAVIAIAAQGPTTVRLFGATISLYPPGNPLTASAYTIAIQPRPGPSDLDVFEAYQPYIEGARAVGIVAASGRSAFFRWSTRERCKCRTAVDQPWTGAAASRSGQQAITDAWLARTPADVVVVIDAPEWGANPSPNLAPERLRGRVDALARQSRFEEIASMPLPHTPGEVSYLMQSRRLDVRWPLKGA
jgi:hypothetical protein